MACVIYREGTGTVEHGIVCESTTCEIEHLEGLLNNGWSQHPPGYKQPEAQQADEPAEDEPDETAEEVRAYMQSVIDGLASELDEMVEADKVNKAEIEDLRQQLAAKTDANKPEEESEDEDDPEEEDDVSDINPVRLKAKDAGIEGWDTKRIGTLEKMLGE